jgi:hypothetical protein
MVAINEILLSECTGEECGGDNDICTDSRVHHRSAENRAPVTGNHRSAPTLGRWLTRDPVGYKGGINLYGYTSGRATQITDPRGNGPPFLIYSTQNHWCFGSLIDPTGVISYCHGTCTCGVGQPYAPEAPLTEAAVTLAMWGAMEACCEESCVFCGLLGAGPQQGKAMTICLTKAMSFLYAFSAASCNCD